MKTAGSSALLFSIIAIATPAPSSAQVASTFSGHSTMQSYSGPGIYQDLSRVGRCLARSKRRESEAFLATIPGTAEETSALQELVGRQTRCLGDLSWLRIRRPSLRGVIAEALYESRFAGAAAVVQAPAVLSASVMDQFADCYARAHPEAVHSLLADTAITSRAEQQAVARMAADFGACLPNGVRIALHPTEVRLSLADAIYRAAVGPAGSVGN